jgi:hypothetical protein
MSSLHRRLEDGEGTQLKVYLIDDVTGWTRVTSWFMGHRNTSKSQRTVMTP